MMNTFKQLKGSFLFGFILFTSIAASSQTARIEELLIQLNKANSDTAQINIMRKLSAAYSGVDPAKKFIYANQYRLIAEKNGIDSVVVNAFLDMGISYGIRGKMDSALYYFNLGYNKSKEIDYPSGIARSHANIGFAYDRLDRKKDAVKSYEESLKIYRRLKHTKGISQNIINLGSLYYDLSEYKIADIYFRENLGYVKKIANNQIGLGNAYFSLGNSNLKLDKLVLAMDYYHKSLIIRKEIGDLSGVALSNWGLGELYLKKNEYTKALSYTLNALKINSTLKNPYQDCVMLVTSSRAHLGLKNNDMAEKAAKAALLKANESNSKGLISLVLSLLVDVATAKNDLEQAAKTQSAYIAIKDSVSKSNGKKDVFINDLNRINSDNQELEKNNKTISAKNANYALIIVIISLILIIVALSLLFYYKRNSEKRINNVVLQKQKQEIAEVNEELSALNEELTTQMNVISNQNTELEKLNAVKNKFFSIVSHDLRGPINNLKMLFELYHNGILDEKELNGLLLKLEDNIYTTASFLDNLLEWAKSQLEGIIIRPTTVLLQDIVKENIKLVDSQVKFKGLVVENKISHSITAFIDQNVINIVVRNLLSNAIKFCDQGDRISFDAQMTAKGILFIISDSGPGISEEHQRVLFDLAYTNSVGTANEKGYQLGLILCNDMIKQSGGSIEVNSKLGEGTTFNILIPANG